MPHDHNHDHCCGGTTAQQSLQEVDFERGLWSPALHGETELLAKRLKSGCDPDARDSSGYTALHYSSRNGHETACRILLDAGADVNCRTRAGNSTPLHRAALQGHKGVVELLLNHGADAKLQDSDGKTALHKAYEGKKTDVVQLLTELCPDLTSARDNHDRKPDEC